MEDKIINFLEKLEKHDSLINKFMIVFYFIAMLLEFLASYYALINDKLVHCAIGFVSAIIFAICCSIWVKIDEKEPEDRE